MHRAWRALMRTPHGAWYDVFFSYSTIVVTYMSKTDPPGQCSVCVFQCVCSRTKHHLTNFMVSACYVFGELGESGTSIVRGGHVKGVEKPLGHTLSYCTIELAIVAHV